MQKEIHVFFVSIRSSNFIKLNSNSLDTVQILCTGNGCVPFKPTVICTFNTDGTNGVTLMLIYYAYKRQSRNPEQLNGFRESRGFHMYEKALQFSQHYIYYYAMI